MVAGVILIRYKGEDATIRRLDNGSGEGWDYKDGGANSNNEQ